MWEWLVPVIIVVALVLVIGIYLWTQYRTLSQLNAAATESWANVTGQLQSRAALVPGAVDTIKHYAPHEAAIFDTAAQASTDALQASSPDAVVAADSQLSTVVRSLQQVAGAYPQLLSSAKYLDLQKALSDAELESQSARRGYNAAARELNARAGQFPGTLFANRIGAAKLQPLESAAATTGGHGAPRIQF